MPRPMPGAISSNQNKDVGDLGYEQTTLPEIDAGPLDLHDWFGLSDPTRPLQLEIGSGKGTFLVRYAKAHPETDFLGIEWARAYWKHAADRCRRHGLANVRVLWGEAGGFVRSFIPSQSLDAVHVYFPDPWPKKRHHKRRLIQAPFLRELGRVLADDGQGKVHFATDHEGYFAWMEDHAAQVTDLFERLPFERPGTGTGEELVGTNFERKYRKAGDRVFQGMTLRKRSDIMARAATE